jgi:predicted PurR-regulated permease PerM
MSGSLYEKYKLFFIILIICTVGFIAWYFRSILICVIVAGVISIIGYPIVRMFDRIHYRRFKFPHVLSVFLTLILILSVLLGLLSFFIPLVVKETSMIANIDGQKLMDFYRPQIRWLENLLFQYGIIAKGATAESLIKENITQLIGFSMFSNILTTVINLTGTFFFNFFAILFLSFFFLNDFNMLPRFILLLVPEKYNEKATHIMRRSKELLTRYFTGLVINVLVMIASYSITLSIAGVRGALVIAFFAGIVNIIPYVGPLIAITTGVILGVTGVVSEGLYGAIGSTALHVVIAMALVVVLDNVVYGPLIQGKSVKVHPVEIFLVIIAAGSIGGIPMMIVAVPGYAFLRIVADEFLSQFRIFQKGNTVEG